MLAVLLNVLSEDARTPERRESEAVMVKETTGGTRVVNSAALKKLYFLCANPQPQAAVPSIVNYYN